MHQIAHQNQPFVDHGDERIRAPAPGVAVGDLFEEVGLFMKSFAADLNVHGKVGTDIEGRVNVDELESAGLFDLAAQRAALEGGENEFVVARILVTEQPDRLLFENSGGFFEGVPQDYVAGTKTPRNYRNPFLVQAMVELNMIDTMGYGIHGMFAGQAKRFFPLPDYDLSDPGAVKMTLYGKIVDPAYSRLLIQKTGLSLPDIQALDRIQKQLPVKKDAVDRLRRAKLIEGRNPHLHIAASIAAVTDTKAHYIRNRRQDSTFYQKLITDYLEQFGSTSRKELDDLLFPKLPDSFDSTQKSTLVHNLLTQLRRKNRIRNQGTRGESSWVIAQRKPETHKGKSS